MENAFLSLILFCLRSLRHRAIHLVRHWFSFYWSEFVSQFQCFLLPGARVHSIPQDRYRSPELTYLFLFALSSDDFFGIRFVYPRPPSIRFISFLFDSVRWTRVCISQIAAQCLFDNFKILSTIFRGVRRWIYSVEQIRIRYFLHFIFLFLLIRINFFSALQDVFLLLAD